MLKKVIYPGTFDPITNGHLDIISRAARIFDEVIVAVALSQEKKPMFDIATRVKMAKLATQHIPNVRIKDFDTLLVNFCQREQAKIIIRGLRAVSDFEYELQIGYANQSLDKELETLYLMPSLQNAFISSSVVRAILKFKGDVSHLVPQAIIPLLESR
ncbi:pantetheine-phosphate adenylyltransferase [Nitratiruptor sp. YY08-26]|uniref:pantetheine-phosphate adenylyltransferase n=1 Tax=unclassified Nitratiruptor TaxID=2624044 RepID=UPI001914E6CD|nr:MULTISPECIES: pantetheine-phosphate adenylyltransferase [unclassified Nitratiruptor]BCD62175.1 pantetheine-phosphate adenylyltransferase [Nitratiruptor sp. YY08-13]BCD66111.1 pantetheine-phosphate adenylyltransferase [Nitratiruptor sp. YY08-26]